MSEALQRHWEFCFISSHTALEQTCKSAVMSAACVVVVGRGEGDELRNLKWRKGRRKGGGEGSPLRLLPSLRCGNTEVKMQMVPR
ncbi:hypothetical protein NQZ68_010651 [Dissostichus eleginoides]|nr:hypothetical protein NQZ68_010651 [Dissostichus eleginoides]